MNSLVIVFAAILAVSHAGLIAHSVVAPVAHGTVLQGPSTKSAVIGPDGSHIVAAAPGGIIETAVDAGYVAHSAPAIAIAHASPVIAPLVTPIVAHTRTVIAHAAPIVAPAVIAHGAPLAVPVHHVNSAFVAHGPHGALIAPGTGIRGQYLHDHAETLYDDGTYKGEFYPHH